jgi:cytochrome-b5 reductase
MAAENPHKFHVWYTVNRPDNEWRYSSGYVDRGMISVYFPPANQDTGVLLCGNKPMKKACIQHLEQAGFTLDQMIIF